jgi:hypothetical protein
LSRHYAPKAIGISGRTARGEHDVTDKSATNKSKKPVEVAHPGMLGDGTEEQNLGERGNPAARIKKDEVDAAFEKPAPKKT